MTITYTQTNTVDPDQLNTLWASVGWRPRDKDTWLKVLTKTTHLCAAWDGEILVGFGRTVDDGVMCMLYDIGVHPEYQQRGIGTEIMNHLIDYAKNKEFASIGLFAWEENPANIPFYEAFGFQKTSGMELLRYMKPE